MPRDGRCGDRDPEPWLWRRLPTLQWSLKPAETPWFKPRSERAFLKRRAERMSRMLFEELAESSRTEPVRLARSTSHDPDNPTPQEAEDMQAYVSHIKAFMSQYQTKHSVEVLYLFEQFVGRDMSTDVDRDRWNFEHPTNHHGVAEIARKLGVWAKRAQGVIQAPSGRGVSPPESVGYAPICDPETARVYWPAAFRQTLLVEASVRTVELLQTADVLPFVVRLGVSTCSPRSRQPARSSVTWNMQSAGTRLSRRGSRT